VLSFDLSGKGGPTGSYATAGIALWIIAPRKPPYPAKDAFVKVEILQGGYIHTYIKDLTPFSLRWLKRSLDDVSAGTNTICRTDSVVWQKGTFCDPLKY